MKVLNESQIIDIKVSGAFYARVSQLALHLAADKTAADIKRAADLLNEGKFEDPWSYHYGTILALLSTIERGAIEQNKVEDREENTEESVVGHS